MINEVNQVRFALTTPKTIHFKKERNMQKVLVAYMSRTGMTEKMAGFIAEGIRIAGKQADVRKISDIKNEEDLYGYDGYVFGCPTYHRDMTNGMKSFLFLAQKANLIGKMGGAFASYTHSGESGGMIFDTMQHVFKMDMVDLGALNLKEHIIDIPEGVKACHDYGRAVADKFAMQAVSA
jgi:flavodoxin